MYKIFVALNFHGLDHQRKFLNVLPAPCVKKWRLMSELAVFKAITFTGTLGPLLWEKFYPVKGADKQLR